MSDSPPPRSPAGLSSVPSSRDGSFSSSRQDVSSGGCGRLGAGDVGRLSGGCGRLGVGGTGGSSSSTRALVSGGQVSSSSRVGCSVCSRFMSVTRTGLLRVHGPLGNRCACSGMSTFSPAGAATYGSAGVPISKNASSRDADVGVNGESVRVTNSSCARSLSVHPLFRPSSAAPTFTLTGRFSNSSSMNITRPNSPTIPLLDSAFCLRVSTLHHVPKAARDAWAHVFVEAVQAICLDPSSEEVWVKFFMLAKCILANPPRGGGQCHWWDTQKCIQAQLAKWWRAGGDYASVGEVHRR